MDLIDRNLIGELVDSHGNVHYEDIKKLPAVQHENKWIQCSKRLPDEPTKRKHEYDELAEYNVMIEGAAIPTTLYYIGDGRWYREGNYYPVERWQPLPEP